MDQVVRRASKTNKTNDSTIKSAGKQDAFSGPRKSSPNEQISTEAMQIRLVANLSTKSLQGQSYRKWGERQMTNEDVFG